MDSATGRESASLGLDPESRFVLLNNDVLLGSFETLHMALQVGYRRCGHSFVVQHIEPPPRLFHPS